MVCTGSSHHISRSASGLALVALLSLACGGPTLAQTTSLSNSVAPAPPDPKILQFDQESYVLGPGDQIAIELFGQTDISKTYTVLIDGTVSLPMVGNVPVRGLTLKQAAAAISAQYARYFKRPIVTARLEASRPIAIGISGEVNRPGTYITPQGQVPKVSLLLQTAGGITSKADVRNVQVRRPQPAGGPDTIINVDLWRILKEGDLSQDVLLRDGDSILIPTATSLTASEATQLATASFAPKSILVNVVGEVRAPGAKELPPNTPLNNAILAAGGFIPTRAKTSEVTLLRLNTDGTVVERKIKIDLAQGINPEGNPTLQNNDVVVIARSGLAGFSDTMGSILSPFNTFTNAVFRFVPGF
uniref:Polysaccharide export protein n=1 Tax=Cyanothece sp. (strain PCC 7425 / ATCC 29141) TaxID=395961 RepID=B8HP75_CYAP4